MRRSTRLIQPSEPISSSPDSLSQQSSEDKFHSPGGRSYIQKGIRGNIEVMTPEVVDAFDKCRVSHRDAVVITGAIAGSLGFDLDKLIMNKSSFLRSREKLRKVKAEKIKKLFINNENFEYITIHWDGKLIPDSFSLKKIDRLPILMSAGSMTKILSVPSLENQTGRTIANAVYSVTEDWGLVDKVQAVCADTTNANFGRIQGAAVLFEQLIGRDLLYLACRHHIMELLLRAAFEAKIPGTSGPEVPIFLRFRKDWSIIDKTNIKNGLEGLEPKLQEKIPHVVFFLKNQLKEQQSRADYKEFVELCLLFLGAADETVELRKPGACHHARFMAKAIYSLKILLLRESFQLNLHELKNIYSICKFLVFVYVEFWFEAPSAIKAPNNDLRMLKQLIEYKAIDVDISKVTVKKFSSHLWYLSPELCTLSFFDKNVPLSIKNNMVSALSFDESDEDEDEIDHVKKFSMKNLDTKEILNKELDFFINKKSLVFFKRFNLNQKFLTVDSKFWRKDHSYYQNKEKIKQLIVVNDCSERAVKLTQDYVNILTTDEEQKQYLIQCIQEFKKECPDTTKESIIKKFKKIEE